MFVRETTSYSVMVVNNTECLVAARTKHQAGEMELLMRPQEECWSTFLQKTSAASYPRHDGTEGLLKWMK